MTMIFIVFTGIIIGVCISLYGWGLLSYRLAKHPPRNWVVTITVGLGAIIFLGGVFNLLRFAYGWTFDILLLIGVALTVKYHKFKPESLRKSESEWFCLAVLGLLLTVIMYFTVQTQLAPKVFHWHDDFEKYFAHPVRMLQTGTLFGSPLSALGSETLGGQAVLHGIVLNHFPIPYINGVDAVFGLLLCLLLSVSMFPPSIAFLPMSLISMLVVFFINPLYVNISALYIASAFMMASILIFTNVQYENEETKNLPPPVLLGLIYAALIAVKSIFIVFPLLHMSFFIISLAVSGTAIRRLVRWSTFTVILTFLFLLPWILLHFPHYALSSLGQTPNSEIATSKEHLNLFSSKKLSFGVSFEHYTFIGMATAICVLGLTLWKHKEHIRSRTTALAGLAASGATIVIAYLLIIIIGGPILSGYKTSLRFTVPFLIAGTPIILSLVYLWAIRDKSFGFKLFFSTVSLLLGVIILAGFSKSLKNRIHQAYESGSILAFSGLPSNRDYIKYNEEVLHGDTKLRIAAAQKQIPSGQSAVIWVYTPFYLDYKRNIIFDVEPAGIGCPWAYMPDADYFVVEYSGLAVRPFEKYLERTLMPGRREQYIAERCIAFLQSLEKIRQNADELYDDGKIVVFKRRAK
jgi:hypothetical protein